MIYLNGGIFFNDQSKKRIILVGAGGSGKDYLRKILEDIGLRYCVQYTTRPIRDGEIEGSDYFFITQREAAKMVVSDSFYDYGVFNEWLYGIRKDQFYESDLITMTPLNISRLKENDRNESVIIYLDIDRDIRKNRLSCRNDADSVERRLRTDEDDFFNFNDYDFKITDSNFNKENWISKITKK